MIEIDLGNSYCNAGNCIDATVPQDGTMNIHIIDNNLVEDGEYVGNVITTEIDTFADIQEYLKIDPFVRADTFATIGNVAIYTDPYNGAIEMCESGSRAETEPASDDPETKPFKFTYREQQDFAHGDIIERAGGRAPLPDDHGRNNMTPVLALIR